VVFLSLGGELLVAARVHVEAADFKKDDGAILAVEGFEVRGGGGG